jgi:long-chain acyl-CoA synthetase
MTWSVINQVVAGPPPPGHHARFVKLGRTQTLDLSELHERSIRVAAGLSDLGVTKGERIGIDAANCLEWALLDLACLRLGVMTAGFEAGKVGPPEELRARYGLKLIFTDRGPTAEGVLPIAEVPSLERPGCPPATVYRPEDATTLKFTSGSTGQPKALAASSGSIDASISAVQKMFGHGPGDHLFIFLPLSLAQMRYWIYSALCFGHEVTVSTCEAAYTAMRQARPTVVMGVPGFYETAMRRIGSRADAVRLFGDRIRYLWTGSAPARIEMLRFFTDLGLPIYEGYGLNETCIVSKNYPGAAKLGSVGQLLPGKQVTFDADGLISVRTEFPVARRYEYGASGESATMFMPDGTVKTGDVGYLDDEGYLFILGRADDVIVQANSRKVTVRPIEERMKDSPAIDECVLFCPDGKRIVAVVSPSRVPADEAAILAQLARANAALPPDQRISVVVTADGPFTIENGLLTSQFKPRRRQIFQAYRRQIHQSTDQSTNRAQEE